MVETTAHNHWPMAYAEARTIAIPLMRAMPSVCIYIASGIERGMERRHAIHDLSLGAARMDMESYSILYLQNCYLALFDAKVRECEDGLGP